MQSERRPGPQHMIQGPKFHFGNKKYTQKGDRYGHISSKLTGVDVAQMSMSVGVV